jgi:hypothetical protein
VLVPVARDVITQHALCLNVWRKMSLAVAQDATTHDGQC